MTTLKLKQIRRDGGTQVREALNTDHVASLADAFRTHADVPPVVVYHDGAAYWCADGFHRLEAASQAGCKQIAVQVRRGDQRAALLYACGANAVHGLPRTNADKRRAVTLLLRDDEWAQWSDRKLAEAAAVSHHFVQTMRRELESDSSSDDTEREPAAPAARMGRDGKTRKTKRTATPPPSDHTPRARHWNETAALSAIQRAVHGALDDWPESEPLTPLIAMLRHYVTQVVACEEARNVRRAS